MHGTKEQPKLWFTEDSWRLPTLVAWSRSTAYSLDCKPEAPASTSWKEKPRLRKRRDSRQWPSRRREKGRRSTKPGSDQHPPQRTPGKPKRRSKQSRRPTRGRLKVARKPRTRQLQPKSAWQRLWSKESASGSAKGSESGLALQELINSIKKVWPRCSSKQAQKSATKTFKPSSKCLTAMREAGFPLENFAM